MPLYLAIRSFRSKSVSYTHLDVYKRQIPDGELQKEQYKEALTYIKKNGVRVYSLVTFASPENLRNMRKDSRVANISIMDVKVSEYSR